MSRKFLTNIDMNTNQVLNLVLQQLATDPVSPSTGQIWFNTTSNQVKYYTGSGTIILYDASTSSTASKLVLRDSSANIAANVATFAEVTITGTPSASTDAATVGYVNTLVQGLQPKPSAICATTEALPAYTYSNGSSGVGATITFSSTGSVTIDTHTLASGDVVLVKNESSQQYNGLYTVTTSPATGVAGVLTRSIDLDASSQFAGAYVFVYGGSVNLNTGWIYSGSASPTVGTTNITFSQFTGAGDLTFNAPLSASGNTISLNLNPRLVTAGGNLDLASGIVSAGTIMGQVTVDTYGRVTAGADLTASNGMVAKTGSGAYTNRTITAGTGISVSNGDGVSGNPTISVASSTPQKYAGTITGDGSTTSFTVTHSLGTQDVVVQLQDSSHNVVDADIQANSTSQVTVAFAVAPANTVTYRVVVIG
jgi:hypothetical protein